MVDLYVSMHFVNINLIFNSIVNIRINSLSMHSQAGAWERGKRADFENILMDKLPDILDINQKKNKIKNNLQALKKTGKINNIGKIWKMSNV